MSLTKAVRTSRATARPTPIESPKRSATCSWTSSAPIAAATKSSAPAPAASAPSAARAKGVAEFMRATLSDAIKARRIVQFTYRGHSRVVEPHMLAANELGHYVLSGWFVAGHSREKRPGWREYFLSGI